LLGGASVALAATAFGVRALLRSIDTPPVESIPIQHVSVLGEETSNGESGLGDPLETAVVATVIRLQEEETLSAPTALLEATEIARTPTSIPVARSTIPTEPFPIITSTSLPSATATTQQSICDSYRLTDFMLNRDQISWYLQVGEAEASILQALVLTWPSENGDLFKVDLGGATIWVGEVASPADIQSWTGGETSRIVKAGERITFRFKDDAMARGYSIELLFANGCRIQGEN
jgi:hypothetical protein